MTKIIIASVIVFFISLNYNFVIAENLTCQNKKNNQTIKLFYDYKNIKFKDKEFKDIFVFGNGISGKHYIYKSLFLGIGKTLDERWEIDIELRDPKTVVLSKYKYYENKSKKFIEIFFVCK